MLNSLLVRGFKLCLLLVAFSLEANHHYYCTAADEQHFVLLLNLIGSIHKNDCEHLAEIAVFDLGFSQAQRDQLFTLAKVKVYAVELVHPDLLKPFLTNATGRKVRGWFAWKPVVIKQALELFPYVLYLDAGATVLNSPQILFRQIQNQGYFLIDTGPHSIAERITKNALQQLISPLPLSEQKLLLAPTTLMISPGLQGVSRAVYESYILPMYETAKNLELYLDDGSASLGFGSARHDQPLFSVYAYLNRMRIYPEGFAEIELDGKIVRQHIHWDVKKILPETVIYQSRWHYKYRGGHAQYLRKN